MRTGFVSDSRFEAHDTGPDHPERPQRMVAALAEIERAPWQGQLHRLPARTADIATVESTHSLAYIRRAQNACATQLPWLDTADVTISAQSCGIAMLAAGSPLVIADAIIEQRVDNGFVLLRPPGHHAERNQAMGFCLFNNVAILARYLRTTHGLDKIAIIDWDVHHGNGTQHSFDDDPGVFFFSVHQYPYYPGTGAACDNGSGAGVGATLNCPLPAGAGDAAYEAVFREKLLPALALFKPECVIISAGFDAHLSDPLADMRVSTAMYGWMTERLLEVADLYAGGRLISVLEGGYDLQGLGQCVREHVGALCGADTR